MSSIGTAVDPLCGKCKLPINTQQSFIYDSGIPKHIDCVDWKAASIEADAARAEKRKKPGI